MGMSMWKSVMELQVESNSDIVIFFKILPVVLTNLFINAESEIRQSKCVSFRIFVVVSENLYFITI